MEPFLRAIFDFSDIDKTRETKNIAKVTTTTTTMKRKQVQKQHGETTTSPAYQQHEA